MKINFEKSLLFLQKLDEMIAETKCCIERLNREIVRIRQNSGTEQIVVDIKNTIQKFEKQIAVLHRMKRGLENTVEMYIDNENKLLDKVNFRIMLDTKWRIKIMTMLEAHTKTDIDWSIV